MKLNSLAGAAMAALLTALPARAGLPADAIQAPVEEMQWSAGPASLPPGTQMIVLEGDPKRRGLFTMRLKVPAGTQLPPHWHPRHERVTVLEGSAGVGFGTDFDQARLRRFGAGSYYVNPPDVPHFLGFPEDAVLQITAEGPWELHYVK